METVRFDNLNDLQSALERLAPGDCVELDSLDLFSDNGKVMLSVFAEIGERGADLVSLKEDIDTLNEKIIMLASSIFERSLMAFRKVNNDNE